MAIEVFLNDLSVPAGHVVVEAACEHLKGLVKALRAVRKINDDVILNSAIAINALSLGDGNSIAALRNSSLCVEEGQFLKRLQDRSPFSLAIEDAGYDGLELTEFRIEEGTGDYSGQVATALGLSWALDGIAFSFDTHEFWNASPVRLTRSELDPSSAEIVQLAVEARNLNPSSDTAQFADFLRTPGPVAIVDGGDLWARREELFPSLHFIPRVRAQIEGMRAGDRALASATRRLSEIEASVKRWAENASAVPEWSCYMRSESASRINKGLVNFADDEGTTITFSDHADFGPGEGRIHIFLRTLPTRHCVVGHVGRKLGIG
jgi:hypothetical protein